MQVANVNVPVQVTGRHLVVTEAIKDYVVKKVEGLHLDTPRIMEAQVILEVQKYRHIAECILFCANHITIEARAQADDLYAAIDAVMGKVAQQMRKFKTRILRHNRPRSGSIRHFNQKLLHFERAAFEAAEAVPAGVEQAGGAGEHLEAEPQMIEIEHYQVRPMYVDEAMVQLEVSDRGFIVFTNAKTDKINVLYRHREDEKFGLIEPE